MSDDMVHLGVYPEELLKAVRMNWPGAEYKEVTLGGKKRFKVWISAKLYERYKNVPIVGSKRNPTKK